MASKKKNNKAYIITIISVITIWILIGSSIWYTLHLCAKMEDSYLKEGLSNGSNIHASLYVEETFPRYSASFNAKFNGQTVEDYNYGVFDENAKFLYGNTDISRFRNIDINDITSNLIEANTPNEWFNIIHANGHRYYLLASYYPDKSIVIVNEITVADSAFPGFTFMNIIYFIVLIVLGCIATYFILLNTYKIKKNISRLRRILSCIRENKDPGKMVGESWNDNLSIVAGELIKINEDRNKLMEKREVERENSMLEEKNKLRSKRILTNNLKHELKTPIGIIQGYLETIINHEELPAELRAKFIKNCLKNVRRIDNLVSSLSMATRLEDGASSIMMDRIALKDSLEAIQEDQASKLRSNEILFKYNIPDDIYVKSNPSLLYALFHNLIKNAINYASCSHIGFDMINETSKDYTFEFWDDGIGVPDEALDHLFDRFYRVENSSAPIKEGSGLGLSIVENTISIHKCTIKAVNRKEGGLTFIFNLPKALPEDSGSEEK